MTELYTTKPSHLAFCLITVKEGAQSIPMGEQGALRAVVSLLVLQVLASLHLPHSFPQGSPSRQVPGDVL